MTKSLLEKSESKENVLLDVKNKKNIYNSKEPLTLVNKQNHSHTPNRQPLRNVENNTRSTNDETPLSIASQAAQELEFKTGDVLFSSPQILQKSVLSVLEKEEKQLSTLCVVSEDIESQNEYTTIDEWKNIAEERWQALKEVALENEIMNETIFEMEKEIAKLNRTIISLLPYKYSWKRLASEYTTDLVEEEKSIDLDSKIQDYIKNELDELGSKNDLNME